jgi:hypothetical protein
MFELFGVSKDAKLATNYLLNFIEFAERTVGVFGFEKAIVLIGQSEWAAGTQKTTDRSFTSISFRLSIPLETFYARISDEISALGVPSKDDAFILVTATDKFFGFGLSHFTDKKITQVWATDGLDRKTTSRALMLVSRLKTYGVTDTSRFR